jgi:hypothetical protein
MRRVTAVRTYTLHLPDSDEEVIALAMDWERSHMGASDLDDLPKDEQLRAAVSALTFAIDGGDLTDVGAADPDAHILDDRDE